MTLHFFKNRKHLLPFGIGIGFFAFLLLAEFFVIILLNSGKFIYTLDDPYIHLAMAENILHGHYGVNLQEFSSPSSSILWPFLLALFPRFLSIEYTPLIINIFAGFATIYYFWKLLDTSIRIEKLPLKFFVQGMLMILLILVTNSIGLIFSGMEHSLQLLFAVMIIYYSIVEIEMKKAEPIFLFAIVLSPLIRYENLPLSLAALVFLFLRKYKKSSMVAAFLIAIGLAAFSYYLISLGLEALPVSILAKSAIVSSGGRLEQILLNLYSGNLSNSRGVLIALGLVGFVAYLFKPENDKGKVLLAGMLSFSIFSHLLFGRNGWYSRYEIYIWSSSIIALIYLYRDQIDRFFVETKLKHSIIILVTLLFATSSNYLLMIFTIPFASNNIYEQQYQMHRFAVEYYDQPIAVNDLGYVSFNNDNYVLDLIGLASYEALTLRHDANNDDWIGPFVSSHDVELIMVYDGVVPVVPSNWIKIGELILGKRKITVGDEYVIFYATNQDAYQEIVAELESFLQTLPEGARFVYAD